MKILFRYSMKILLAMIIFSSSTSLFSQNSSSEIITKDYNVDPFTGIKIGGAYDVVIEQGETQNVKISTEGKFLEMIQVDVNDGILVIKTKSKSIKANKKIDVHITFVNLNSINISGATELSGISVIELSKLLIKSSGASEINLELKSDNLTLDVSGAGKARLSGVAEMIKAEVSGAAVLKAKGLKVENAEVNVSGAGNAYLNVTSSLECNISGAGNVNYIGNPTQKEITKSGSGTVSTKDIKETSIVLIDVIEDDENVNVKLGNLEIEVIEQDDTTKITVGKHKLIIDEQGNVKYNKCKVNNFNGHWGGIDFGVNGYLTENGDMDLPQEYDFLNLRQEKSWTVGVNLFEQNFNLIRNHFGLITGIGFQWINYRFDNNIVLNGDSSTIYGFKDYSNNYTKSKLAICFVNIPVLLEYQTNRHMKSNSFHLTAGMIFGLRLGSHSKMVYDDGNKQKIKNKDDFHLHPFKMDANVRIGWGWINLFGTYSVTTLFAKNKGPELYPFTAGITLVGW